MRIRDVAARLAAADVPSPERDAALLLAHVRGVDLAQAYAADVLGTTLTEHQRARLEELVCARVARVPLQHLTGWAGFRGLVLRVGPGVFVPRPETELVVDLALAACSDGAMVVDLCAGSGAIALALAQERPGLRVHAVEVDPLAHAWAARNLQELALEVDLRLGRAQEAFDDLVGEVDVVVSNPPYIPVGMVPLDPEVADHDPPVALYGGSDDGLAVPLEVADRARELLRPGGMLVMEHAQSQGDSLPSALTRRGWLQVEDHHDLTGRPRAVTARTHR